jgi:hypothetical protein
LIPRKKRCWAGRRKPTKSLTNIRSTDPC